MSYSFLLLIFFETLLLRLLYIVSILSGSIHAFSCASDLVVLTFNCELKVDNILKYSLYNLSSLSKTFNILQIAII